MKTVARRVPRESATAVMRVIADKHPGLAVRRDGTLRLGLALDYANERRALRKIGPVDHRLRIAARYQHQHVGSWSAEVLGRP